ncbi:multidrug efflux RND transporter permease subunit [Symmachiella dynata]|uniref:efflux RND transporter permease subunit n=1 Tax=Symmachiella dynata TaxID=2527995 RepID=UPI0030EE37F0
MFSHFFIDRPIFATVLSVVILIVGSVSFFALPVAQYPEVTPPTIQVTTTYPGANAKTVAETVATPIENEVNGVEGMIYMSSRSTNDGQMSLDVTFELGTDIDMAQVFVQNRVAIAMPKLPEEVSRQGVTTKKRSPSILMCVNVISPDDSHDSLFLSNFVTTQIKDDLSRVKGVGDVVIWGARDFSMRLWLDPQKLAARDMTAGDVMNAVREQNVQVAAGRLGSPPVGNNKVGFQYTLNTQGRLLTEEEFGNIIVRTGEDGRLTRLKDIGRVELGAKTYDMESSYNGATGETLPSITVVVFQLPGSNALETAQAVRDTMSNLKAANRFPSGVDYKIDYDTTLFIEQSINDVYITLLQALGLVFLVVLIFLQSWRATIIPMVAVPVSLIGALGGMALFGFSLNNLSLFGLVLAIGVVVDDAIVIVEAVETHLAAGMSRRDAARTAMTELFGPVIATSLVLLAVFVPTAFMAGISGQFYKQFALTIAAAVIISTFNALTLSPALCALLLKPPTAKKDPLEWLMQVTMGSWLFKGFNWSMEKSKNGYGRSVYWIVRGAFVTLLLYGGLLGLTFYGFIKVPQGFIPQQDKGYLIVNAQLPDAASLERSNEVVERMVKIARDTPGVKSVIGVTGYSMLVSTNLSNAGTAIVVLEDFDQRAGVPELSADAIAAKLRMEYAAIQEAQVAAFGAPPIDGLGSTGGFKLQVRDIGGLGLVELQNGVQRLAAAGNAQPGLVGLFSTFSVNQPQLYLDIDRTKAKTQGVALNDLFETLQVYLGSGYANDFTRDNRNWQVNVQADAAYRLTPEDIGRLRVRNDKGDMVPLATLVQIVDTTGPAIVNHYQSYPSAEINGNNAPGTSSGDAIMIVDQLAKQQLGAGLDFEWTDLTYQQIEAGKDVMTKLVFPLSVLFVFLVLSAQYESWSLPLAVILIVPMCLLCSIAGVLIAKMDSNIFTQIGQVLLVGLSAKNAILIVEFARNKQDEGLSRIDAVVEACRLRLRPILMTAFSSVLGFLPLIIATGAGAEMRIALGVGVVAGMLGVTFFGLFFTPVFYSVIMKFADRNKPQPNAEETPPDAPPKPSAS